MRKLILLIAPFFLLHLTAICQDESALDLLEKKLGQDSSLFFKWNNYLSTGNLKTNQDLDSVKMEQIIKTSLYFQGTKHCMGGTSKKCIDCSGLLFVSFRDNGIQMPHNAQEISRYGTYVLNKEDIRKGDLLFFVRTYNTKKFITHAGIGLGNNQFIHTSSSKGVMISELIGSDYWESKFIFAKRLFED